jgi:uncharacterized protein YhbP (UPF0306 family)
MAFNIKKVPKKISPLKGVQVKTQGEKPNKLQNPKAQGIY